MKYPVIAALLCFVPLGCATVSNMDSRASSITSRGSASLQAAFTDYGHAISGSKETRSGFGIRAIDGITLKSVYVGAVHELAPGKHTIEILATRQRGGFTSIPSDSTVLVVEFTASPGIKYQASGKISEGSAEAWISEVQSGRLASAVGKGELSTSKTKVTPVIILPE